MNDRMVQFYMKIAEQCASMSRATRLNVGAVVVKDNNIISFSWNGTPSGWDNGCEYKDYRRSDDTTDINQWPFEDDCGQYRLVTKPEVLHAEMNSLMKLAKNGHACAGSYMFVTHSPCIECAKGIVQAGIVKLFFKNHYRSNEGIALLQKSGIEALQVCET